uniref:BRCT domain-containing protein n=1 Tax=Lygus hesperus TaxID=30085 RepID=A0A146L3D0_LYGHE
MDTWTKLIPRALFTSKDGSPICALLDMEDSAAAKILTEMFEARGGSIISKSPNPYAIILTDRAQGHSRITIEHPEYPVFNVEWIVDCIDSVELVNINPYLMNTNKFEGRNFMEVIFEKLETSKGTLLVNDFNDSSDCDWMAADRKNSSGKKTRRRGPPKEDDYVKIEIHSLSRDDDVYCEIANFAVTQAIESVLRNERILVSQTKDQLKRHDPDVENRIVRKNLQGAKALLNGADQTSVSKDFSNSGRTTEDGVRLLRPSISQMRPKASDELHILKDGGGQVGAAKPTTVNSIFRLKKNLHCTDNVLPLSSRVRPWIPVDLNIE